MASPHCTYLALCFLPMCPYPPSLGAGDSAFQCFGNRHGGRGLPGRGMRLRKQRAFTCMIILSSGGRRGGATGETPPERHTPEPHISAPSPPSGSEAAASQTLCTLFALHTGTWNLLLLSSPPPRKKKAMPCMLIMACENGGVMISHT